MGHRASLSESIFCSTVTMDTISGPKLKLAPTLTWKKIRYITGDLVNQLEFSNQVKPSHLDTWAGTQIQQQAVRSQSSEIISEDTDDVKK